MGSTDDVGGSPAHHDADVCVIGAGPAGMTLVAGLRGSGLRVLVLESGSDSPAPGGDPYGSACSVGLPYPLEDSRVRGVGGCALHWDVQTPSGAQRVRLRELDAIDFEDRPEVRRAGWPLSESQLLPYYAKVREDWSLGTSEPAQPEPSGELVEKRFSFGRAERFTRVLPDALAADPSITVMTSTTVTELRSPSPGAPVSSAVVRGADGRRAEVMARVFVLAGGGIENARLLLVSRAGSPAGLGNTHDQVGRCFMEHPHFASGILLPTGQALMGRAEDWDVVLDGTHPRQRMYALSEDVQRREGLPNIVYYVAPRPWKHPVPLSGDGTVDEQGVAAIQHLRAAVGRRRADISTARHAAHFVRVLPQLGRYAASQLSGDGRQRRQVFTLSGMAEQEPNPDSRVTLSTVVDRFGVPEATLDWRITDRDAEGMRRSHALVAAPLARRLSVRVETLLPPSGAPHLGRGFHHMGTTRMSHRPEHGVVDADCRVHGVPNLFVAGSSVFPTSGSSNPTLTLVALSVRLADRLRSELQPLTLNPPVVSRRDELTPETSGADT